MSVKVGDLEISQEEFSEMDFDTKYDAVIEMILFTNKIIVALAHKVTEQIQKQTEYGTELENIGKAIGAKVFVDNEIRKALDGRQTAFSFYGRFEKERDVMKRWKL